MTLVSHLLFFAIFLKIVKIFGHNVIDVDDILSEDFMPGTLLMLENPKGAAKNFNESIIELSDMTGDGSFGYAMETMGYHR